MEVSIEQSVIAFLFTTLSSFVGVVIKSLWTENKELKTKLHESNRASRDLIAMQAEFLRGKGVQVIASSQVGENR